MSYQLDEDSELPGHLLELFLRSAPNQLAGLVQACAERNVDGARAAAHKLKGSLFAAGASRLASSMETLRSLLARPDFPEVERQLTAIRDDMASLLAELEQQLRERGA